MEAALDTIKAVLVCSDVDCDINDSDDGNAGAAEICKDCLGIGAELADSPALQE